MNSLEEKFDQINTIDDLQPYSISTDDGESSILELKSLQNDSFNSDNIGKTKAILAKEVCAFLNTNDGLILWGGDIDKTNQKLKIENHSDKNLANLLDSFKLTLTDPAPTGIRFKDITDKDGNIALLIFVPKSIFAPHRVGSWDVVEGKKGKDKTIGRYFQRIGTSSQVMPENLVRSMYLSNGRLPTVDVWTSLDTITEPNKLTISAIVKPDKFDFIESYHLVQEISLIGSWLNPLDQDRIWKDVDDFSISSLKLPPIYPSENTYTLWNNSICLDPDSSYNQLVPDDELHLTSEEFSQVFAIATRTAFSARGIQIKYKTRLYIIGPQHSWIYLMNTGVKQDEFRKIKKLNDLEKRYNVEIFVSLLYQDAEIIDDRPATTVEPDNTRIKVSHIENLLKTLANRR